MRFVKTNGCTRMIKKGSTKNQDNKKRVNGIGTIKLNYACGAIWS